MRYSLSETVAKIHSLIYDYLSVRYIGDGRVSSVSLPQQGEQCKFRPALAFARF